MKTIIVAEVGSNHCCDLNKALRLVDVARNCGADIVKFQAWDADRFVSKNRDPKQYEVIKKFEIPRRWYKRLAFKDVFYSVFNPEIVDHLESVTNPPLYKIASGDFTNMSLIDYVARTKKQIFISCGGATCMEQSIFWRRFGYAYTVEKRHFDHLLSVVCFHCVVAYPAQSAHLGDFLSLQHGYSDHTKGILAPCLAVVKGAKVIEKHIKLERCDTPDDPHSLEPMEFKRMVKLIRETENHLAITADRPYEEERPYMKMIRRGKDGLRPND